MAADDMELRRMGAFENSDERSGIRVPKKRKMLLILIDILTLIAMILVSLERSSTTVWPDCGQRQL